LPFPPVSKKIFFFFKVLQAGGTLGAAMDKNPRAQFKPQHRVPQPQNIRRIENSFAWLDHRLLRLGYLPALTHQDMALYLFLILAADRYGVSFYRQEKIGDILALDVTQLAVARDRLLTLGLIAFEPYSALSPNGFYQVLPVREPPPAAGREKLQQLTKNLAAKWKMPP